MENVGEVILYQPDHTVKVEVRLEDETVWLTQAQMTDLFQSTKQNISLHINNIYKEDELQRDATVKEYLTVQKEGLRSVQRKIEYYNLDVIISVGYRVKSKRGTQFRQWASQILKDYLLRGYSVNQRLNQLEDNVNIRFIGQQQKIEQLQDKVDFFIRTSLPPVEGIFFNGQIFDAYTFASDLIKLARKSIVLIDNYVDESVLIMLAKRAAGVNAMIYTGKLTARLQLDLSRYNSQYPAIQIEEYKQCHDRFIIIDDDVYHIGASLKDLGKKWFAFSKMNIPVQIILKQLQ